LAATVVAANSNQRVGGRFSFGHPVPVAVLFGVAGRELLARMEVPEAWNSSLVMSLSMVDVLDEQIDACARDLLKLGADHHSMQLLVTVPGVGWVLAYTIPSEIGDIGRFSRPKKLLCPTLRSGRPRYASGRLTTHLWNWAAVRLLPDLVRPPEKAIER
jgi:transposase